MIYPKRIYTPRRFRSDLSKLLKKFPKIVKNYLIGTIERDFASKVMLAVTIVNGCRYCRLYHESMLKLMKTDTQEIKNILNRKVEEINEYERPAIVYALHYAESDGNPSEEMREALYRFYGREKAEAIELFIEMVTFANLGGNTFDALLNRLKGIKAPESNFFFELFISLLSAPILVPLLPFVRKSRN